MRRLARLLAALAFAAAASAVGAPAASAEVGGLTFDHCIAHQAWTGCTVLGSSADALRRADGPVLSSDGRHLYVAGIDSDAISRFDRDPLTGRLSFAKCWAVSSFGCTTLGPAVETLEGVHTLALSPDGQDLYAALLDGDAVAHFSRDPGGGELAFEECFGHPGVDDGCTDLPAPALDSGHWVRVSPDGEDVYAAGELSDSIVHFSRDSSDGSLEFEECHAHALTGCAATEKAGGGAVDTLREPHWFSISPDGAYLYAGALASDAVAIFARDPDDGSLALADCVAQSAGGGCTDIAPANALDAVHPVEVSPDGRNVYTAALGSDAVAQFDRDPSTGGLVFVRCWGQGAAGCADVRPSEPLIDAHSIGFSPDGRSLYVGAIGGDSLAHFARDPASGALTLASCIGQGAPGCASVASLSPFDALDHAIVSPDGAWVYVTAAASHGVSGLRRELSAAPVPVQQGAPTPGSAAVVPPALAGAAGRRARVRIAGAALVLGRSGRVTVRIACAARGRSCAGVLSLRRAGARAAGRRNPVLLGRRRFRVRSGRSARVGVRLSRRARAFVRRGRRVRVRVSIRLAQGPATRRIRVLRAAPSLARRR